MKVCLVDPPGYNPRLDVRWALYLAEQGFDVDLYISDTRLNGETLVPLRKSEHITLRTYGIAASVRANKLLGLVAYLRLLRDINRRSADYTAIQFIWNIALPLELPFLLRWRHKLVFTFHNHTPRLLRGDTHAGYRVLFYLSRHVVFLSKHVRNRFLSAYRIPERHHHKAHLVKHGLLPVEANPAPEIVLPESVRVVFWGYVKGYKGIDNVLRFLQSHQSPIDASQIAICGRWDPALHVLRSRLQDLGVVVIDRFMELNELAAIVREPYVFFLPYNDASQSGVVYTLLGHRCVFAASDHGDPADVLRAGGLERLVFDEKDDASMGASLSYALEAFDVCAKKMQKLAASYEWPEALRGIGDVYRECAA